MGKSAPAAPDPVATANAQGAVNADTARLQARLNRGNTSTPFGSVTNRDLGAEWMDQQIAQARSQAPATQWRDEEIPGSGQVGGYDENGNPTYVGPGQTRRVAVPGTGFDEEAMRRQLEAQNPYRDQWQTDVNLSPEQQRLYEQGVQLDTQTGQLALDQIPAVRELLSQPYAMDDADARDRATAGIMSRMEPQFARDREALESRLTAQGFRPGTEAYATAADELGRARTDARMQAITAGLGESRAGAAFSNAQRAQRVNELGMLFGLGPGMQMPQAAQTAQSGVNPADLTSGIYSNYQAKSQQAAAGNAQAAQLAGTAMMAAMMFSDRRVKDDVERVGKLDNGLPVYAYRYKGSPQTQIGVMAQDVERRNPEAVGSIFGVKAVDYRKAVR